MLGDALLERGLGGSFSAPYGPASGVSKPSKNHAIPC